MKMGLKINFSESKLILVGIVKCMICVLRLIWEFSITVDGQKPFFLVNSPAILSYNK